MVKNQQIRIEFITEQTEVKYSSFPTILRPPSSKLKLKEESASIHKTSTSGNDWRTRK